MKAFTDLYLELDLSQGTKQKVSALKEYFLETPPEDAVHALAFLSGKRPSRVVKTTQLREWMAEFSGYPLWLVEECYDHAGDLAETLSLLKKPPSQIKEYSLGSMVNEILLPMQNLEDGEKKRRVFELWDSLGRHESFVFHKLLTGGFRVGVAKNLVIRGLSVAYNLPEAILAHRMAGEWPITAQFFEKLVSPEQGEEISPGQPYPFFLAHALTESEEQELRKEIKDLVFEWKWDGIRGQLIKRAGEVMIWSRGDEAVTESFPEIADSASSLPDGTVLDGEILAWKQGAPLSFFDLQRRLGRKSVGKKLLTEVPVKFIAYDLLEDEGRDMREVPLRQRRERLQNVVASPLADESFCINLSHSLDVQHWSDVQRFREQAREEQREGIMIKRLSSSYGSGRKKGAWWKWKVEPYTFDAVLLYAQKGHGRRAGVYTDYTFAVWDNDGNLVPVTKAYSGLTDADFRKVDAFIRKNTVDRFGPVRSVKPQLVFELAFEGVRESSRHKSGIAMRFPRMKRLREDKTPREVDSLRSLQKLIKK